MNRLIVSVFCVTGALLLVGGVSPAQASQRWCSNSTLEGSFGYTVTGFRPGGVPFAAVGRLVFNGSGGVSTVRTLSNGGVVVQGDAGTGRYTLKADCTGSFSIGAAGVGSLSLDMVVDDDGDQIRGIVTNSGFVLTLEGRRQK